MLSASQKKNHYIWNVMPLDCGILCTFGLINVAFGVRDIGLQAEVEQLQKKE